ADTRECSALGHLRRPRHGHLRRHPRRTLARLEGRAHGPRRRTSIRMSDQPLDLLAIMAHPDDAELLCGGTLARAAEQGYRTGILDLTGGESGTHGDARIRHDEARRAAE